MSKRRSSERGAGETTGRASKLQCPGISGNNAKRAGPFILGKGPTCICTSPKSMAVVVKTKHVQPVCVCVCVFVCVWPGNQERHVCFCVNVRVVGCLRAYARLRQECQEFC